MEQDPQTWIEELVARHQQALCQYAYRITGNAASACDVVQETFLQLCRQPQSKIEAHAAAWLYRVCRNRALDWLRKEKPMQDFPEEQVACLPDGNPTPAESAEQNDKAQSIRRAMSQLPERQQEVLRLKFQHHLSYREIASITRLKTGHVGWLIHTGLAALKTTLQPQEVSP